MHQCARPLPPPLPLQLPTGARQPLPYLLTVAPPLALAFALGPAVFLDALDVAGTYGQWRGSPLHCLQCPCGACGWAKASVAAAGWLYACLTPGLCHPASQVCWSCLV